MKRIVLWFILLLVCVLSLMVWRVNAEEPVVLRDFKGLDTRSSDLSIDKHYCRAAHEVDFSRIIGTASKRKGYEYVDSLNDDGAFALSADVALDTLTSIYPAYLTNGKQSLIYSAFTRNRGGYPTGDTLGWNNIYMTGVGTALLDTVYRKWGAYWNGSIKLYDIWPTLTETYYATFNDILYASNGVSRGMVADIDKRHSAPWPLPAPGEPRVVPVSPTPSTDTTYKMNGEYRYTFFVSYKDGATWYGPDSNGIVTRPVRCDSQQVLMTGFNAIPNNTSRTPDSIRIYPYRTRANTGRLDELDTAFYTGVVLQFSAAQADSVVYVDSLPDADLDTPGVVLIDPTRIGYDTAYWMRYGAPTYLSSSDSAYRRDDSARNFIWGGGPGANMDVADTNMFPVAYGYMVTFLDTLLNIESDSSRTMFISQQGTDKLRSVRVGLPPIPPRYTHTVRRLYRSMVLVGGRDTSVVVQTYCNTSRTELQDLYNLVARSLDPDARQTFSSIRVKGATGNNYYLGDIRKSGNGWCFDKLQRTVARDTLYVTPYMMVDEMKPDSVAYTDSLRTDSIMQHHWYQASAPPPYLTHIFGANNRIFGIQGARLYQSRQDTIGFGAFSFVSINEDDGDVGTFARMTQRGIRFYKNQSSYIVPIDPDGGISEYAPVNGIGLIAPNSGVLTPYGFTYLSGTGVMVETEGEQLERVYKSGLVSGRLDNFDKIPLSVKSKAKGVYTDNKYILYVPSPIDTAYVYDFLTDAWATWSFPISGAALYGTEDVVTNLPGDTLFFYKPNSRTLFKYGGETDNGAFITTNWKSAPILADGYVNQILGVGTWTSSDKEGALYGKVYNQSGLVDSVTTYSSDMTDRYQYNELGAHVAGLYAQISIEHTADTFFSVAGFDVHWARLENVIPGMSSGSFAGSSDSSASGITEIEAGAGLTGGGTSGTVTINVGGSTTITVSDNALDVNTSVIATKSYVDSVAGVGVVPDSVLYSDSSGYADTAGVALNGGSTDSIYVKRADSFNTSGWVVGDDTLFVDTTGGGGGMTMDSTTAGNGLIESANDLAVRPGFGIDTTGDLVVVDTNEIATKQFARDSSGGGTGWELTDSLARINTNIDSGFFAHSDFDNSTIDTVTATGKLQVKTGGIGTTQIATGGVQPIDLGTGKFKIDAFYGDSTVADSHYTTIARLNKIADDTAAFIAAKDTVADWDNGALDSTNLALGSVLSSEIKDGDVYPIDLSTGKFKINAFLGDSTVADSQYATIARVGKIADDTTNWNTVYTDYNTNGWETGDIYNGTLEPIDIHNTSKWNGLWYQADTTVADSAAATIARLNKIADDTANFKIAYDSSQHDYYRSNEVVDSATGSARAEIADSLTDSDEKIADKAGAMVTGNTESQITVTYQDADNTLDFTVGVVDSATGAARAEIADSALHVDTSYAPLVALVNRHIRDTAAVMIEDSLDSYFLSASDLDPDQLTGDATDNNLVDSSLIQGIQPGRIASGGASLDDKLTWNGSAWVPQAPGVILGSTDIYGSLIVHGQLNTFNDGNDPDIYNLKMFHADTLIYKGHMLPYYMRAVNDTNASGYRLDSLDFVHPSGFYDPNMTFGWKMIVSFTGAADTAIVEDPFIRVSNDGVNWYRFKKLDSLVVDSCIIDSIYNEDPPGWGYWYGPCYDSFFTEASDTLWTIAEMPDSIAYYTGTKYDVKYLSDNEMIHGHDGDVHLYIRGSAVDGGENLKSSAIYHKSSSDMITWSDTVNSIPWYDGMGKQWDMLSPSVFLGSNQSYNMLAIHTSELSGGGSPDSISYILRWRSNHPDTGWVFMDTVRDSLGVSIKFGKNSESRLENDAYAWHLDVVDWGADAKIVLISAKYKIAAGTGWDMYVGKTRDDGRTMEIRKDPILRSGISDPGYSASGANSAWDYNYIYKGTGWRIDKGDRKILQIPYSSYNSAGFHAGMGTAEFLNPAKLDFTEVAGRGAATTDSVILTLPQWNSSGVVDRWIDSTSKTSGSGTTLTDSVFMRATARGAFSLDTLVLSNFITTDSGTGRSGTSYVYIDSIIIYGPDFSSGTNSADSAWWGSSTNRVADTRTTLKIALNIHQLAPAGSVFKIAFINKLVAAKSAVHMERVAIIGKER